MEISPRQAKAGLITPITIVTIGDEERNGLMVSQIFSFPATRQPVVIMVGIWEHNYSCELIKKQKEFAINTISEDQMEVVRPFAMMSGRDVDKFKESGVETFPASKIKAPLLRDSPINLECKVIEEYTTKQKISIAGKAGSFILFLAEVVAAYKNNDKQPVEIKELQKCWNAHWIE
jgi:flavin reductase (DIM6/NTAB) family NADH-FMN oxidoreductase RutF